MRDPKQKPAKPNGRSRSSRTKLLDELTQQKICAIVTLGCSRKTASEYVGCGLDAIRNTARRMPAFAEQLDKAETVCEVSAMTQLGKAVKDERNWRAVIWLLERRYPDRYGRRSPRTASPRQIAEIVHQFVEIVSSGVTDVNDRQKIVERMQSVVERLRQSDEMGGSP